ncbi:MAG TPA: DNA-directed RNA polymerase subunit alpha [Chloroflexota bacterium]|nr:DNA-directed RNA polymerase subunit alpha [Chloroflexota bacterium]
MIEPSNLPTVRRLDPEDGESDDPSFGAFVVEPLTRGYGHTMGNAMRRVLLSSLPGAAVSSIRIDGVHHEFSTIPDVKEDVTQIVLNIKKLRLRSFSDEPVKAQLDIPGPGTVTANDIRWPDQVEIVNSDQAIATLDSDTARLSMELTVTQGTGFVEAEAVEGQPIGEIPVDAIYTPIRKVEYHVGAARVGQSVNLDRLLLRVWTDGTITAEDAVVNSAKILVDQFKLFAQLAPGFIEEPAEAPRPVQALNALIVPPELAELSVDDLELSNRTLNCLKRNSIVRVGQLASMTEDDLLHLRNFGDKSLQELKEKLAERGVRIGPSASEPAPV